jgi:predicted metal-dependent phosphoesterase TrpH
MNGTVDLHMHTIHSDGSNSPAEIVRLAKKNGLDTISITDHDSLNGFSEAFNEGKKLGVEVIPGVEISSDIGDHEVHILGYFMEPDNEELESYLVFFRGERYKRAIRIVDKLRTLGFNITIEDILQEAQNSAIGRPHIAHALLRRGFIHSYYEAFNKYIGNGCPAHEKKVHISPQSAFKIITDAGGLSFIAHPGYMPENILKELIEEGVDGLEVVHPSHSINQVKYYRGIANEFFLLESGGSDFHGGKREDEKNFGKFTVSNLAVDAMRRRLLKNSA